MARLNVVDVELDPAVRKRAHNLARAYGYQRADAEDVVQQAYLRLLETKAQGSTIGNEGAWLNVVVANILTSMTRHRRVMGVQVDAAGMQATDNGKVVELPDNRPTPEEMWLTKSSYAGLRRAVSALPKSQREVIELILAGYDSDEIALRLNLSPDAVRQRKFKALARLRSVL